MDRPIVSIIIPVYNVENYIAKAVESIGAQSLTNWELFLVDDGSIDKSGEICEQLALGDERIQVIHQENKGAALARNAAIDLAKGKYLFFMDADDWAAEDMLYDLVCLAENYEFDAWAGVPMDNSKRNLNAIGRVTYTPQEMIADVPEDRCAQLVVAAFYIETYYSDMDYYIQKQSVTPRVFASKGEFRDCAHEMFDRNLLYTPWNKLYLTSYIRENKIYFPDVHWDDFPFNLEVIRHIERVTVTDHAYYHFLRKRADSESEKYNAGLYEKREEENKWLLDLYDGWKCEVQQQLILEMKEKQALLAENAQSTVEETAAAEADDTITGEIVGENINPDDLSFNFLEKDSAEVPVVKVPEKANEFISRRYLERVVGCVENITNPACEMSKEEKIEEIKKIVSQESVRTALKTAKPKSLYMKAMLLPIKAKSAKVTYLEGLLISKVKTKNVKLFAKLKANR